MIEGVEEMRRFEEMRGEDGSESCWTGAKVCQWTVQVQVSMSACAQASLGAVSDASPPASDA